MKLTKNYLTKIEATEKWYIEFFESIRHSQELMDHLSSRFSDDFIGYIPKSSYPQVIEDLRKDWQEGHPGIEKLIICSLKAADHFGLYIPRSEGSYISRYEFVIPPLKHCYYRNPYCIRLSEIKSFFKPYFSNYFYDVECEIEIPDACAFPYTVIEKLICNDAHSELIAFLDYFIVRRRVVAPWVDIYYEQFYQRWLDANSFIVLPLKDALCV